MKKFTAIALTSVTMMSLLAVPVLALDTGINYGTALGLGTKDVRTGVMSIVSGLFTFLGVIAILIILWGGFRWMTAGGNEEGIEKDHHRRYHRPDHHLHLLRPCQIRHWVTG